MTEPHHNNDAFELREALEALFDELPAEPTDAVDSDLRRLGFDPSSIDQAVRRTVTRRLRRWTWRERLRRLLAPRVLVPAAVALASLALVLLLSDEGPSRSEEAPPERQAQAPPDAGPDAGPQAGDEARAAIPPTPALAEADVAATPKPDAGVEPPIPVLEHSTEREAARPAPPEPTSDHDQAIALVRDARRAGTRGNHEEAIAWLLEALALDPDEPRIYLMLYTNYSRIGERERAAEALRQYLAREPDDGNANEYRLIIERLEAAP